MIELGVNIDHIATVRQARRTDEPDPVWAAALAQMGGADGITVHLREDRRHIQDRDLELLRHTVSVKLNMEMACVPEILEIACRIRPNQVTIVPERREELTTEGGLDLINIRNRAAQLVERMHECGVAVSMFLPPDIAQIECAREIHADAVEIHTGHYALSSGAEQLKELENIRLASYRITELGMALHAGHGLTYHNVRPIAQIPGMHELNIGHSIISRAMMLGMMSAVSEMKKIINS